MTRKQLQGIATATIIALIIIIDQWLKIEVKTTMRLHESHEIASWFYIFFIENNGMAYGMSFIPKIALSLFRLVAIIALGWYVVRQILNGARWVYVMLLAMVIAGAAGNLIDCMFYGLIFTPSTPYSLAELVPMGQGCGEFLHGRVVDMFYFPIIRTQWPEWMPIWGGQDYIFFSPVFNFADAAISCSVVALLLFCRKELQTIRLFDEEKSKPSEDDDNALEESKDTAE